MAIKTTLNNKDGQEIFPKTVISSVHNEENGKTLDVVLDEKADKSYVDNKVKTNVPVGAKFTDTVTDVSGKADKSQVLTNVPLEAVFTDTIYDDSDNLFIDTTVETVPPQTTVVDADTLGGRPAAEYAKASALTAKADKIDLNSKASIADLNTKASIVDLNTKADKAEVYVKADKTYVDNKVKTDVPVGAKFTDTLTNITGKADITYVDNKVKTDVPVGALFTDTIATKESIGLTHVTNTKQMPMTGGAFTGVVKAKSNNDLANAQLRNVIFSTENPEDEDGEDGDIWFVYKEAVE